MCTCQPERGIEEESQRKEKEPMVTVLGGEAAAMGRAKTGELEGHGGEGRCGERKLTRGCCQL